MPPGLACSAICTTSLSARRAWIEITVSTTIITICIVALRKESVDRNCICIIQLIESGLSLSARRAWIEMFLKRSKTMKNRSLSARRAWIEMFRFKRVKLQLDLSLSARRAWIEILADDAHFVTVWSLSARRAWIEMRWIMSARRRSPCRSPQGERG